MHLVNPRSGGKYRSSLDLSALPTLEEAAAGCGGGCPGQSQPHHGVCPLGHSTQTIPHHLAEPGHRRRDGWDGSESSQTETGSLCQFVCLCVCIKVIKF